MATKKPTKATTAKRKPAAKSPKRTKISPAMKTHKALASKLDPLKIEGFYDDGDGYPFLNGEQPRQLTIVASRRFLWWEVHRQRIRQNVTLQPHTVTQAPDGAITYSVPMKVDGPCETILSPWWERALYAVARIWS